MTNYEFPKSKATAIFRGLTHACPKCSCRKTHSKYFSIKNACPRCGLKFEKESGYWTGSMAINMILTGGTIAIGLAIGLISTAPDIKVVPILATLIPLAVILPILLYPFCHTIWMAIDYGFLSKLDD
jgi:uncharacterized protein (DUF983 family)